MVALEGLACSLQVMEPLQNHVTRLFFFRIPGTGSGHLQQLQKLKELQLRADPRVKELKGNQVAAMTDKVAQTLTDWFQENQPFIWRWNPIGWLR